MDKFLQILIDALAIGSLYGLIALGYTMVYGVLQFINFSHSSIVMIGAWTGLFFLHKMGWQNPDHPLLAYCAMMAVSISVCMVLGFLIEFLCYRPLRQASRLNAIILVVAGAMFFLWLSWNMAYVKWGILAGTAAIVIFSRGPQREAPRINALITSIGISIFLERLCQFKFLFGTEPGTLPRLIPDVTLLTIGQVKIPLVDVLIIGIAVLTMVAVDLIIQRTKTGIAMRAVAHDAKTAALMGINANRIISFTFLLGSALAGLAGTLYVTGTLSINQPAHPTWTLLGLKAFVAAVIGGIGNVRGAMIGGLIIGLLELFGAGYLTPQLRDVYVFGALILILLIRPSGLLSKPVMEKV